MKYFKHILIIIGFGIVIFLKPASVSAQDLPIRYATLELFTNTPCPICASQNPGLFNRLANYEGQYHLIGFYPGSPYSSCIFYQANIPQNSARVQHYSGEIFGSPTVALNGIDFKSSSGVNTTVLDNLTGGTSWLYINVDETTGTSRSVTIDLQDVVGGSLTTGRLYAVIVEKEISYNAPNGETLHHNVFRRFLTDVNGEDVDLTSGQATKTYQYAVSGTWNADETYVIAWLMDPTTEEIYNSGTRFDADFTSAINPVQPLSALSVYPNPSSTEVNITLPSGATTANIEIYDPQGRLVRSLPTSQGPQIQISTTDFLPGKYFIKLTSGKEVYAGAFDVVK